MKKQDFSRELKNACTDDSEIERTKQLCKLFGSKNGEKITTIHMKTDIFLVVVLEHLIEVSTKEYGFNPLYCFFM